MGENVGELEKGKFGQLLWESFGDDFSVTLYWEISVCSREMWLWKIDTKEGIWLCKIYDKKEKWDCVR